MTTKPSSSGCSRSYRESVTRSSAASLPLSTRLLAKKKRGGWYSAPLVRPLSGFLGALKVAVWVEHELLGRTLVEVLVALRSLVERDDRGVYGPGDLGPVVEDRHHQLPVVLHDRALARG